MILRPYDRFPDKFQNRPRIDPKARLTFGFPTPETPVLRFSDPRSTLSLDFCRLYRCCIDTVSILYRYSIDTVSISYRYSIDIACKNPKTGCFWGRKTERQVLLGSENRRSGELWGRFGGSEGRSGGVRGGSGEAAGGRIFFFISGGLKL